MIAAGQKAAAISSSNYSTAEGAKALLATASGTGNSTEVTTCGAPNTTNQQ